MSAPREELQRNLVAAAIEGLGEAVPAHHRERAWATISAEIEAGRSQPVPVPGRATESSGVVVPFRRRAARRPLWAMRIAAAAAAIVILATTAMIATPGSLLYPVRTSLERAAVAVLPGDRGLRLGIAKDGAADLVFLLRKGSYAKAPNAARALVVERATAIRVGADVSGLDAAIASEVPPALASCPEEIATAVRAELGDLLPSPPPTTTRTGSGGAGSTSSTPGSGIGSSGSSGGNVSGSKEGGGGGSGSGQGSGQGDGSDVGSKGSQDGSGDGSSGSGSSDSQGSDGGGSGSPGPQNSSGNGSGN